MKKLYFTLACSNSHRLIALFSLFAWCIATANAQNAIPNPGFENWTNQGQYDDPDGWGTLNSQTASIGAITVVKATGANAHSGSSAINLITKHISFLNLTAPGVAGSNGTFDQGCSCFLGGVSYNLRPDSIAGWYKYSPVGTDTASVEITLSKWNGTSRDVVGYAKFTKNTSVTSYTEFRLPITYSLSGNPDTMVVILLSSWTGATSANANSSFFVDDLSLTFPATPLTATSTSTDATCNATCNGTASVVASGGTSPYTYSWSNGQTTSTATGLCAGSYSVTVTDGASQTVSASAVISQPTAITASVLSTMPPLCNGQTNGSVDLSASGGTGNLTFSWSNGFSTEDLTGVGAGTYLVTVTDANGCTKTATATVTQPSAITLSLTSTDESSSGANDGTASVTASGGTTAYSYSWSNGATTASVSGLAPNTYTVTVTDANGCTISGSTSVNAAGCALSASAISTIDNCGQNNGTATVTATQTHTITVANFSFTPNSVNAVVGDTIHWVWSAGSHTTTSGTIPTGASSWDSPMNSTNTSFKYVVTQVGTYNYVCTPHAPNMAGVINVSGAFTYAWSNGQATATATGLATGNYDVTVTGAGGCNAIANISVGNNAGPAITASFTDVTCNGANDGTITTSASSGISPYTFAWDNGATTQNLTALSPGTYTLTITDAGNCTAGGIFTITEPAAIVVTTSVTPTACGTNNGTASASGGVSYVWSANANNQTDSTATGLAAGTYSVTVTDANGCMETASATVSSVGGPSATISSTPDTAGQSNGTATVNASGGTPPYTYAWGNGQTDSTATGLAAGTYSVTVMDANNCSFSITATVSSAAAINALSNSGLFFSVYPNPSSDGKFRILFPQSLVSKTTVKIYNVIGKEIYKKELEGNLPVIIDLGNEAAGIYYFNMSSGEKILTKKIAFTKGL